MSVATVTLTLLGFLPSRLGMVAVWALSILGGLISVPAAGWSITHPRSVWPARGVAWRWSFWFWIAYQVWRALPGQLSLERDTGFAVALFALHGAFFLVTAIVIIPIGTFIGLVGAAVGVRVGHGLSAPTHAARVGVHACGIAASMYVVALVVARQLTLEDVPPTFSPWSAGVIPLLTAAIARVWLERDWKPEEWARSMSRWFARHLIWSRSDRGRSHVIDLRGAALGTTAAALALILNASGVTLTVQAWVLASLMQARNQPAGYAIQAVPGPKERRWSSAGQRLVLLTIDDVARRKALTAGSESELQASVIHRLSAWGAARVVLPMPLLMAEGPGFVVPFPIPMRMTPLLRPSPTTEDVQRSRLQLPELTSAVRQSGRVLLLDSWGEGAGTPAAVRELQKAVWAGGPVRLDRFGLGELPAIPVTVDQTYQYLAVPAVSVPIQLVAALRDRSPEVQPVPGRSDQVEIAGIRAPLIETNKVLVNFHGQGPSPNISNVSYSSVLSGGSQYMSRGDDAGGDWIAPDLFFRDRIVFLDTLAQPSQLGRTPDGPMSRREILANATNTLLSGLFIRRLDPRWAALLTLGMGLLVGQLCLRRSPAPATAILLGFLLALVVACTATFVVADLWIDMLIPCLAAIGAYLLVTQFTFRLERTERDRNRAMLQRFVSPKVVEELLDDPEAKLGLGGTRQSVCVLFADIRGFTGFSEQHTPEEVVETSNAYLTAMTDSLLEHGGILDKFTGDGMMAFFRIKASPREDVTGAVRAALAMQEAAAQVSARLKSEGKEALGFGIGIHYGDAVVGLVGSPIQSNYTAMGHAVNVSQRLGGTALAGEIIVSESVYEITEGEFHSQALDPVQVKGVSDPVASYRVLATTRAL